MTDQGTTTKTHLVPDTSSREHDKSKCQLDIEKGPFESMISEHFKEFLTLFDKDKHLLDELKDLASTDSEEKNSFGVPHEEMAELKGAKQFMDILQKYGMITQTHTTFVPWLMEHADGVVNPELRKLWYACDKKRPKRVNLGEMPDNSSPASGTFKIEVEVQVSQEVTHLVKLQELLAKALGGRFPKPLISLTGSVLIETDSDQIFNMTLQMVENRRKLRDIPQILYEECLKVPSWISEMSINGIHISGKPYIAFIEAAEGTPVDKTCQRGATGQEVVHAAIQKITDCDIFVDDKGLLRRIAHVATKDGKTSGPGGIFKVPEEEFEKTKQLTHLHDRIKKEFGINWDDVQYPDLDIPMTSAITTILVLGMAGTVIPDESETESQAEFYFKSPLVKKSDKEKPPTPEEQEEAVKTFVHDVGFIFKDQDFKVAKMDLAIVLDGSGSVGKDFKVAIDFICRLIDAKTLDVGKETVRIGVIQYSNEPRIEHYFKDTTDKESLKKTVREMRYMNSTTATDTAIEMMTNQLFSSENGAREGLVSRIGIILTDGDSNKGSHVAKAAKEARKHNITLFAVGIGNRIKASELEEIANQPKSKYVATAKGGFSTVENILATMIANASKASVTAQTNKDIPGTLGHNKTTRLYFEGLKGKTVTVSFQAKVSSDGTFGMYLHTSSCSSSAVYRWKVELSREVPSRQVKLDLSELEDKIYATVEDSTISTDEVSYTLKVEIDGNEPKKTPA